MSDLPKILVCSITQETAQRMAWFIATRKDNRDFEELAEAAIEQAALEAWNSAGRPDLQGYGE